MRSRQGRGSFGALQSATAPVPGARSDTLLRSYPATTARKRDLRCTIQQTQLDHLARVAEVAAREAPELARKLVLRPKNGTCLAFRIAARGMAAEAQTRKELLVKYGMADTVFDGLTQALEQFDAAVEQGTQGRRAHVGASAELHTVADEVVQVVKVMDGLNRFRFAKTTRRLRHRAGR